MPARVQLELSILGLALENKVWILGPALENKVWILGPALEIKFWILGPALHSIIGFLGSALEFSRVDCKHVHFRLDTVCPHRSETHPVDSDAVCEMNIVIF